MTEAFLQYGIKLVIFGVVAFCGVKIGIILRNAKDKSEKTKIIHEIKNVNPVEGNKNV